MLNPGPAKKVSLIIGEDHQYHHHSAYAAILDYLFYRGVSGANVTRGIAGFGADHHLHTTRILRLSENLPVRIEFIESSEKVQELLPKLHEMVGSGLIEVQDTIVEKPPSLSAKPPARPQTAPIKREGKAKLMRIYVGENDKWRDKPLYRALVESMRANEIAGVTVYQCILGYGANRRITVSDKDLSHDRPIMLSVVDTEEKLRAYFPVLDGMVQQGLVVLSDVDIVKYSYDSEARNESSEV